MDIELEVGINVANALKRAKKPQLVLSDVLKLTPGAISRRLNGKQAFDVAELQKISEALGISYASLALPTAPVLDEAGLLKRKTGVAA